MRGHLLFSEAEAWPEDDAEDERGPAGAHVNHRATGEVDRFDAGIRVERSAHEAVDGPDHVGEREVDNKHPDRGEEENRRKFHAFCRGAEDERRGDDREGELEHGPDVIRDPVVARADIAGLHAVEAGLGEVTQEGVPARESEAVAAQEPKNCHQTGDAHRHGENRQHILRADEAAVEKRQAGKRHEKHERRAGHLPRIVTGTRAGDLGGDIRSSRPVVHIGLEVRDALFHRRLSWSCLGGFDDDRFGDDGDGFLREGGVYCE